MSSQAKAYEGNILEMRRGSDGKLVAAVRRLKESACFSSEIERSQVLSYTCEDSQLSSILIVQLVISFVLNAPGDRTVCCFESQGGVLRHQLKS